MLKKLTTKEDLLKALTDKKLFSTYQLSFYYHFNEIVDTSLLDDYEVMKTIIEVIPHSYKYIKYTHLKDNRDLVIVAIKARHHDNILKYASAKFRKDTEIAALIFAYGIYDDIPLLSKEFLTDIELMSKMCKKNPIVYKYLPTEIKDNETMINGFLESAKEVRSEWLYKELPERYLNNKEFILSYIVSEKTSRIYNVLSEELKKDYDIAYKAAQFIDSLRSIENDDVKDDFDIVANSIIRNSSNYMYASERLKNDERIFNVLLEKTLYEWSIYKALPDKFKQRKEILLRFDPEMVCHEDYLNDVPESLQKDIDVINHFGSEKIVAISYFWYHGYYTKEEKKIIKDAIHNHDYDTFMEMYNKNGSGLPQMGDGQNEKGSYIPIDITIKENFMKITFEDSEAG